MARPTPISDAQQQRNEGLARLRRLTWFSGIGAAALTALASIIAAVTIPGHSQAASSSPGQQPATTSPTDNPGDGGSQPQDQPTFAPPDQLPSSGGGAPPVVVSGGS